MNGSVTDLETLMSVQIGKVLDGTESVLALGPRFQHHPPKNAIVELATVDISVELLCQDLVKLLMQ